MSPSMSGGACGAAETLQAHTPTDAMTTSCVYQCRPMANPRASREVAV
jgi:hypothetical protein